MLRKRMQELKQYNNDDGFRFMKLPVADLTFFLFVQQPK